MSSNHSYSAYETTDDLDGDSFSSKQSKKYLGSTCIHANISLAYTQPLFPRESHQSTSSCESDDIASTVELGSDDGDDTSSDDGYYGKASSGDLLSLDSVIQKPKASCNRSDDAWRFDLPSFQFFAPPSSHSNTNGLEKYEISSTIPFSHKKKLSLPHSGILCCPKSTHTQLNGVKEDTDIRSRDSIRPLDHMPTYSSFSTLSNSLSLNQSTSEYSERQVPNNSLSYACTTYESTVMKSTSSLSDPVNDTKENIVTCSRLKNRNFDRTLSYSPFTTLGNNSLCLDRSTSKYSEMNLLKKSSSIDTFTTYASTITNSNSSSSDHILPSSDGFVHSAINFSDQCLKRSNERRSSLEFCTSSPSSLSLATSEQTIETIPSLVASHRLSPVSSSSSMPHGPITPSTATLYNPSVAVKLAESLLDDTSISSHSFRAQQIKRKLRSMEIKYYRRKCVWSLRKSMEHYTKLNTISDSIDERDDSSICSELSIPHYIPNVRFRSISQGILQLAWEIICLNVVITAVCTYFYEHTLHNFCGEMNLKRLFLVDCQ